MTMHEFADRLRALALEKGAAAAETCVDESEVFRVKILDGAIDSYTVSNRVALGLRVEVDGKNGYAGTQTAQDAEELVARAIDNARTVEQTDENPMQTAQEYESVEFPACPLCELSIQEKIELAKSMEQKAKAADARVFQTPHCVVSTGRMARRLKNTCGLDASVREESGAIALQAAVREDEEIHDGFAVRTGAAALDVDGCVNEAVQKAVACFGAASVRSGKMPVLFDREAASDILGAFSGMFCADMAQKGLSPLAGKEGQIIAADGVTILDDPFYEKNPRAFDGEGTPSEKTTVVENGASRTFLHNLKTAKKAGVRTTANAGRSAAASPVDVSPYNFYIAPGKADREAMLSEMQNGVLIREVSGLHAGLNAVTGDFSLLAAGFLVENGKQTRAVEQVTVAGNFLTLLQNVRCVGNDLLLDENVVGSPSLLVRELTVSGSEE